jgi:DNA-binding response OmpR family regulator
LSSENDAPNPFLFVPAHGVDNVNVFGLVVGAVAYLPNPFSPKELVARVRALLRRNQGGVDAPASALLYNDLEIDPEQYVVRVGKSKKEVSLTAKEFQLLHYLASRPGRVATRDALLDEIWKMDSEVETRTVDVHMRRLRKKLGSAAAHLKTLRGVGYKFSVN